MREGDYTYIERGKERKKGISLSLSLSLSLPPKSLSRLTKFLSKGGFFLKDLALFSPNEPPHTLPRPVAWLPF